MIEVETDKVPSAVGPYSQAIKIGNMVYTSGQIPLTSEGELISGDIHDQTKQVLTNLKNVLEEAGTSLDNVVKTTIYLSDIDSFISVNTVYATFFQSHKPARSTIAVKTLPMNVDVEIEAIAIVREDGDYSY